MVSIKVESKKFRCSFSLYHKLTLVTGESGRGKSVLIRALTSGSEAFKISVTNNYRIIELTYNNWFDLIHVKRNAPVIYIADDEEFVFTEEFARSYNEDKSSYFIIINRFENTKSVGGLNNITFGVDDIYLFKTKGQNGRDHYLEAKYNFNKIEGKDVRDLDLILTEDSGSGYEFFKNLELGKNTECSAGKDKLLKYLSSKIDELSGKKIFIVLDSAAFGSSVDLLDEYCKQFNLNVLIDYRIESFEYLLLVSNMFSFDKTQITENELLTYSSRERLYFDKLKSLSQGYLYEYRKGKLSDCYMLDCCCQKQNPANPCTKGMKGSKAVALFKTTEFSYIADAKENE